MCIRTITAVFVALSSAYVVTTASAQSPMRFYEAIYTNYFSHLGYFPVIPAPQEEESGDIYASFDFRRPAFEARRPVCFLNAPVTQSNGYLPDAHWASLQDAEYKLAVSVRPIIDLIPELTTMSQNMVSVRYGNVTSISMTNQDIRNAMSDQSNSECRSVIDRFRFSLDEPDFTSAIPAILPEVVYANQIVDFHFVVSIDPSIEADLKARLQGLPVSFDAEASQSRITATSMSVVSTEVFLVAWRPAFVSEADIQRMRELQQNGIILRVKRFLRLREDASEEIQQI